MKYYVAFIIALLLAITILTSGHSADCLDMNTVVDYEATADGLLLTTKDGSGYFLEIHKQQSGGAMLR